MKSLVIILICSISIGYAQKVVVVESEERIEDVKRKGLSTVLELDEDLVKNMWFKKLKEFGSTKSKSGLFFVEQATIGAISPTFTKIISKVEVTTKGVKVFYALDLGDSYVSSESDKAKYTEAEKILRDFGVSAYLADINAQIKEAEKVLMSSVRDQEKMISKGESIRKDILENRSDKIKLEKKLEDNANQYKQFKLDSIQNIQNQLSTSEIVEKMKKSVEAVRAKISKVE